MLDEPDSTYSGFGGLPDRGNRGAQRQQIAVDAETADLPADDRSDHGMRAEGLAGVDVRHVQLDDRHREHREGVAQAVAVVSPGAGVDQYGVDVLAECAVNPFAQIPLVVGLKALDFHAQLSAN